MKIRCCLVISVIRSQRCRYKGVPESSSTLTIMVAARAKFSCHTLCRCPFSVVVLALADISNVFFTCGTVLTRVLLFRRLQFFSTSFLLHSFFKGYNKTFTSRVNTRHDLI